MGKGYWIGAGVGLCSALVLSRLVSSIELPVGASAITGFVLGYTLTMIGAFAGMWWEDKHR